MMGDKNYHLGSEQKGWNIESTGTTFDLSSGKLTMDNATYYDEQGNEITKEQLNKAKKIADEAIKNAPVVHKIETELRIEDLESQVSALTATLEQAISSLTTRISDTEDNVSNAQIQIERLSLNIDLK